MSVCAVIPAAGRGSRLGIDRPKLLAPIADSLTIFDVLRDLLLEHVDHVCFIVSPGGQPAICSALERSPAHRRMSVRVQEKPTGMGDAIFCGFDVWRQFDSILVVWGDQVLLSPATVHGTLGVHSSYSGPRITIPLTTVVSPYVQYDIDESQRLIRVRQRREGNIMERKGLSDVGAFALSTGGLANAWEEYLEKAVRGAVTGEINFLPFLPYLSRQAWRVLTFDVADPSEARGINTPEDLRFARERLAPCASGEGSCRVNHK